MIGRGLVLLAAVFTLLVVASNSQAEMTRMVADCWTHNELTRDNLNEVKQCHIHVQVFDTVYARGPDFVASINVTAPDGTLLSLHPSKDFLHPDNTYFKAFEPSVFKKGKIPGGTYSVEVTDSSGAAIKESDYVDALFLDRPEVIFPYDGAIVNETPVFTWTAPQGASYYRLMIWDNWANEPVYWWFGHQLRPHDTSVEIPRGAFKPGRPYTLRVEARSSTLDMDRRSRSAHVNFTTGSW